MEIRTVGDLRKQLECCEDDEPIFFKEWYETPLFGEMNRELKLTNASSTAGGRAVVLWLSGNKEAK